MHCRRDLIVAADAFGFADPDVAARAAAAVERLAAPDRRCARGDQLAPPGLSVWARAQRTLQPYEAWLTFRDWIDSAQPALCLLRRA